MNAAEGYQEWDAVPRGEIQNHLQMFRLQIASWTLFT